MEVLSERSVNQDGEIRRRQGHPTAAEINAGRLPSKYYDLIFVKDGERTPRAYSVRFTNMVVPDKTFNTVIAASSLRALLSQMAWHIGSLRSPQCTTHFTITGRLVTEEEGMVEEIVHVPLAQPIDNVEPPAVDPRSEEPIRLEE